MIKCQSIFRELKSELEAIGRAEGSKLSATIRKVLIKAIKNYKEE